MNARSKTWIDVYPIDRKPVFITPTGVKLQTSPELTRHIDAVWKPQAEKGRKSSLIPLVERIDFGEDQVMILAGYAEYAQAAGNADAIARNLPFAPQQGFSNFLSVGVVPVTSDGFILLQRRSLDLLT